MRIDNIPEEQFKVQELSSNSQIAIYALGSILLFVTIIILLYYRRNKFKSLINHFENRPENQTGKHKRKLNSPITINSNYENNHQSFNDYSPFEQQFLKNTAQLNYSARTGAFSFKNNNRDKLSLSESGIGRVLEQSIATIKKRTTLKSISPLNEVEFHFKKIDSQSKNSQSIPLIDFLPFLNELTKTNNQKIFNEFMQLDIRTNGFNSLKKNSSKAARISKNKDGSIVPFDHSRIVLEANRFTTSDCIINANFIPGLNSLKEYIACQNPLKSAAYSFWLMCIQQSVKYIVMTTRSTDSFLKMHKYWPDFFVEDGEEIQKFENITIKLRDKKAFKHFTVRIFDVKMNEECKLIKHYQLTDWTDVENYENVIMLTEFIKLFRDEIGFGDDKSLTESPIVVHCNNGVGKTACFIAVDRIYTQLKKGKNDHIDIFGTVYEMRQYRPLMIQNQAQYKFIYDSIGELVRKMNPSLVKQLEFDKTLDEINLKDFDANNNLDDSYNSQISLVKVLNHSINKSLETKSNGYINQTFVV